MSVKALGLLGIVAVMAVGCERRHYDLDLTPRDGKLERRLTGHIKVPTQGNPQLKPLTDDELARIAAQYAVPAPRGGGPQHTFSGAFAGRQPNDIGGFGAYHEWNSEFGIARLYVERFRGKDDLVESFDKSREAIHRAIELLLVWIDETWANQPERLTLRKLVDTALRRDLENLCLYLKAAELHGESTETSDAVRHIHDTTGDIGMRVALYLTERQYFEVAQLPRITRLLEQSTSAERMQLVQELLRRQLGIAADEPLPPALAIFADETQLLKSLNDSLRKSPEYALKKAEWEQKPLAERTEAPEEPVSVISDLFGSAFHVENLFFRVDELAATLRTTERPIATNGNWDPKRGLVTWSKRLAGSEGMDVAPEVAYAVWAEPNVASQEKQLRGVVLRDLELFDYCLWRNGLTMAEAAQWKKFLAELKPEDRITERIKEFVFDGEDENSNTSRTQHIRGLLGPRP